MNKREREEMIERLAAENAVMAADTERRRQHRILNSDGSDLVTKSFDLAPDLQAAQKVRDWASSSQPQGEWNDKREAQWQAKRAEVYRDARAASVGYVETQIDKWTDLIAEEVADLRGELETLRDEIRREVAQLREMRAEIDAVLKFIGKPDNVKAA